MIKKRPLISIIVPVYNRESVLKNCIESILNQTYNNIQIILVDDGSTDNSLSVCQSYVLKDSRVCVLHQKNSGPAIARNAGLDVAKGKYIMFVDSDDCLHQKCIETMYGAIQQYNVSIAMCEFAEQNHVLARFLETRVILMDSKTVLQNGLNEKEKTLYCWAKLWDKEVIRDVRFKSASFCEDNLFSIEAFLNCRTRIASVKNVPLYYYLNNENSITKNLSDKNLSDSLVIVDNIFRVTEGLSSDIRNSAINYCICLAFFAYLQASDDSDGILVRNCAFRIINKYRETALYNFSSSLKVKIACLISYCSMDAVSAIYRLIKQ